MKHYESMCTKGVSNYPIAGDNYIGTELFWFRDEMSDCKVN
jgi:hypothetical protein